MSEKRKTMTEEAQQGKEGSLSHSESIRAKKRWAALLGRITAKNTAARASAIQPGELGKEAEEENENLIEEIKRMKKKKQQTRIRHVGAHGGVLSLLHSHPHANDKTYEKQKHSAKERILRKRTSTKTAFSSISLGDFDNEARLRYPITSDIRIKLERIKREAEKEEEKQEESLEKTPNWFMRGWEKFIKWLSSTNIGETIRANHRFYKMSPQEHLPELCRRCRRPLAATLESRFTAVGICFAVTMPIIGILLLYANREFVCVVCDELYVYGELTARPVMENYSEGEEE